ncbi:DUF3696 domain-containing protein [Sphingopyxis sp.]|uniref:DUF3696 domain-containing protein n=1 Tax=Sphingopyxis sp. TaxID=1908224 RepID=UPI003D0DC409
MLKSLRLGNFKCFEDETFSLGALTVLSGINGAGKSSVVQALLILRQVLMKETFIDPIVSLSGELVDIGRASDILFTDAEEDLIFIEVNLESSKLSLAWMVNTETGEASWANFDEVRERFDEFSQDACGLFNGASVIHTKVGGFNYLNAERLGPRKALTLGDNHARLLDVGKHGEHVFDGLLRHGVTTILASGDARRNARAQGDRLRDQVEAWLEEISPGVQLSIRGVPEADIAMGSFTFGREGALRSPEYRPTNVGFGLSYVLPVLVSLLSAPKGGLVVIENPEAHLHPRGQTMMGDLCARAAAAGVQVIIETHSDHVLDGVRLAVQAGVLSRLDAVIHYLSQENGRSVRRSPVIDDDGRLSEWPEGFFDQHRKNAAQLIRPKRS